MKIDSGRDALIVTDLQYDFLPGGALGDVLVLEDDELPGSGRVTGMEREKGLNSRYSKEGTD